MKKPIFFVLAMFIASGLTLAMLVLFELSSRLKYFYDTRHKDVVFINENTKADFEGLKIFIEKTNESYIDFQSKNFELNPINNFARIVPNDIHSVSGHFLGVSGVLEQKASSEFPVYLALVVDDKVISSKSISNENHFDLKGYISEDSKKVEFAIHLADGMSDVLSVSKIRFDTFQPKDFYEFLKQKGIYEWTWDPAKLSDRNLQTVFRADTLPVKSDPDMRVFSLGGSTTYGLGAPRDRSISRITESKIKEQVSQKIRIYNFGIVGVGSETTSRLIKEVIPTFKPAAFVIHDGYNDLPIIFSKSNEQSYQGIKWSRNDNYYPIHPHPIYGFVRYNFWSTWNRIYDNLTALRTFLSAEGDVFMGLVSSANRIDALSKEEIKAENDKRTKELIANTIEKIEYAKKYQHKIVIIIEPEIFPDWTPNGTGFRDKNVGVIQKDNHDEQQQKLLSALKIYKNDPNIRVLDLRKVLSDNYRKFYHDESHLNEQGNEIIARYVSRALLELFEG